MTSTSLCGKTTQVVTQTAKAPASTLYSTKTLTTTQSSIRTTTILATKVTTVTVTSVTSQTSTTTLTSSATSTTQQLATATADPCADPYSFDEKFTLSTPGPSLRKDASSIQQCCRACYLNTDCVIYKFDPAQQVCDVYFTSPGQPLGFGGCVTAQCPNGNRVGGYINNGDGGKYGIGPCAGSFVR
jgi:hypothetical protein